MYTTEHSSFSRSNGITLHRYSYNLFLISAEPFGYIYIYVLLLLKWFYFTSLSSIYIYTYLGNLGKGFEAPPHGRSVAPAVNPMRSNSPNRQRVPGPLITDSPITHSVGGREEQDRIRVTN